MSSAAVGATRSIQVGLQLGRDRRHRHVDQFVPFGGPDLDADEANDEANADESNVDESNADEANADESNADAADLDAAADLELASPTGDPEAVTFKKLYVGASGQLNSVPKGGKYYYSFDMKKGYTYTVKMTYYPWGGDYSKDPDLYTHNSSSISLTNYLCRPYLGPGKSEKCTFVAPWNGLNYAMVHGFTDAAYYISVTSP